MKISYNDLCQYLLKQATIEEISSRLFQLGHENEILGDIIDVDFTPNRGDCLSVRGLARDLGVFYKFNDKKKYYDKQIKKYNLNFTNNSPEDCPNISFLKIKIGDYTNSYEQYLEDYFKKFGINKNNLLTDISNYLAYEIGQPTHCYDLDKIDENIEFNKEILDCEFKTLLGKKISLTDRNCFFSSNGEIINLAGVVGSKNSSCSSDTSSVLLECAYFLPKSIIGKSLKYDIKSDAAHKFERGVDPLFQEEAIRRFIFIVSEHAEILDLEFVSFSNKNHAPVKLDLNSNKISKILGHPIDKNNYIKTLESLNFLITENDIFVPSYRHDISSQNDLAEEMARVIGYDKIQSQELDYIFQKNKTEGEDDEYMIKDFLSENGFYEVINFPFTSLKSSPIFLDNPLDSTKSYLRTDLKESLIENMLFNERRQKDSIKIFEISHIYEITESVTYSKNLGILISGRKGNNHKDFSQKLDKDYLKTLFKKLNFDLDDSQIVKIDRNKLDSKTKRDIYFVEIRIRDLSYEDKKFQRGYIDFSNCVQYKSISEYPSITRDLSFLVTNISKTKKLHDFVMEYKNEYLKNIFLFDFYKNANNNEFKMGFRFIFQSNQSTLKDSQIDEVIEDIINNTTSIKEVSIPGLK